MPTKAVPGQLGLIPADCSDGGEPRELVRCNPEAPDGYDHIRRVSFEEADRLMRDEKVVAFMPDWTR